MNAAVVVLVAICATQCTNAAGMSATHHPASARSELDGSATRGLLQAGPLKPISKICKQFRYKRYFRASTFADFETYGRTAQAGDMVELMPGRYVVTGYDGVVPADPAAGYQKENDEENDGKGPTISKKGNIMGVRGTATAPIVFCGTPGKTIVDGADSVKYATAAIKVVRASYIRVAGFTLQNALKGLDVQGTTNSEFSWITTRQTLQEGVRLRYNSTYNVVKRSTITYAGLLYKGVGEGVYCGSGKGNSVDYGRPADKSDYNVIRNNKFGPGMTAEGVDVKEYTTGGQILENVFDGADLSYLNGAISWVAVKGNGWTIANNTGGGLQSNMVGFKVVVIEPGQGEDNVFEANTCRGLRPSNLCVYVDPEAPGNQVACSNIATSVAKKVRSDRVCNCSFFCGRRSAAAGAVPVYAVPALNVEGREEPRYDW